MHGVNTAIGMQMYY